MGRCTSKKNYIKRRNGESGMSRNTCPDSPGVAKCPRRHRDYLSFNSVFALPGSALDGVKRCMQHGAFGNGRSALSIHFPRFALSVKGFALIY
jgi:hypothetical protein